MNIYGVMANEFDRGRLEEEDDEIEKISCEDEDSKGEDSKDGEDMIIAYERKELGDEYLTQEGFGAS